MSNYTKCPKCDKNYSHGEMCNSCIAEHREAREKAIEKLKKVLNLARNAGTEGEAAAAYAQAKRIMIKYNLTEADAVDSDDMQIVEEVFYKTATWSDNIMILGGLMTRHFYVNVWFSNVNGWIMHGTKLNCQCAAMFFDSIYNRSKRLHKEARKNNPFLHTKSFYMGIFSTVDKLLKEQTPESVASEESCTALVLSAPKVPDRVQSVEDKSHKTDFESFSHGREMGHRAMPSKGITA